jgi:hypothetical protein
MKFITWDRIIPDNADYCNSIIISSIFNNYSFPFFKNKTETGEEG